MASPRRLLKQSVAPTPAVSMDIAQSGDTLKLGDISAITPVGDIPDSGGDSSVNRMGNQSVEPVDTSLAQAGDAFVSTRHAAQSPVDFSFQDAQNTAVSQSITNAPPVDVSFNSAKDANVIRNSPPAATIDVSIVAAGDVSANTSRNPQVPIDTSLVSTGDENRLAPRNPQSPVRIEIPASDNVFKPQLPVLSRGLAVDSIPNSSDSPRPSLVNPSPRFSLDSIPSPSEADRDLRFQTNFDGEWLPDWAGVNVGPKNYQTLRNMNYRPDRLEGIDGSTRINTNATGKYLRDGIQFTTPYTQKSYILVQGEDSDGSDRVLIKNTQTVPTATDFDGVRSRTAYGPMSFYTRLDGDPTTQTPNMSVSIIPGSYTATELAAEIQTRLNLSTILKQGQTDPFTVTFTSNRFTITCASGVTIGFVYVGAPLEILMGFTASITPDTSISSVTEVTNYYTPFFTEDASASAGWFSKLPEGHVGFCDGKANKIWAGDEMPVGGFFLIDRTLTSTFFEEWVQDYTDRVNNSLSDSNNVVVVDAITKTFGDATSRFDVTASTTTNGNFRYTYDGTGTAPLFVTNGLEIGHVVVIPSGTGFAAGNIGNLKVTAVAETYFEVENPSGAVESNIVLGYATGMTSKGKAILIGTFRRATAFKFDISSANTTAGVVTVYGWDGDEFVTMTNSDGTASPVGTTMGQDGTITLTSNTSNIVPVLIGGRYLYWYMFTFVTMTATIQQITAQCDFQNVADIWDGIWRVPIHCGKYVLATTTNTDYTLEAVKESYKSHSSDATATYVINAKSMVAKNDYLEFMFEEPVCALQVKVYTPNNGTDSTVQIYTNTGSNWEVADMIQDSTVNLTNPPGWEYIGGTSLYRDGVIQWQIPSVENKVTTQGKTGYVYRMYFDADTGANTEIDTVYGMPSYRPITTLYSFPAMYRNRAFWCEKNRIDYSSKYRPDVYNGTDASGRNNERSLKFGSIESLTAFTELFNQFSDGLDSIGIALKNTETHILSGDSPTEFRIKTLSRAIGCPSHKTLDTAEVTIGNNRQNVAIWVDANVGPVMCNGATIQPFADPKVKKYWTPGDDAAIPAAYVGNCAGIYDPNYNKYHLVIPSGASATYCNTWLTYDLTFHKWGENYISGNLTTDDFPQAFLRVEDTNGVKYIYALTNTGFMIRIDNGRTWSDGTGLTYTVKTGDALFTGSMWDEVQLDRMKVLFEANAEGYMTVNHYLNGDDTATAVTSSATPRLSTAFAMSRPNGQSFRNLIMQLAQTTSSQQHSVRGLSHAFEFIVTNCTASKPKLLGWAAQFVPVREDTTDMG